MEDEWARQKNVAARSRPDPLLGTADDVGRAFGIDVTEEVTSTDRTQWTGGLGAFVEVKSQGESFLAHLDGRLDVPRRFVFAWKAGEARMDSVASSTSDASGHRRRVAPSRSTLASTSSATVMLSSVVFSRSRR